MQPKAAVHMAAFDDTTGSVAVDKPSLDMKDGVAAITYIQVLGNNPGVYITSSDQANNYENWLAPAMLSFNFSGDTFQNPIVKLFDRFNGYVSVIRRAQGGAPRVYDVQVARISRQSINAPWAITSFALILRFRDAARTAPGGPLNNPRDWRDRIPMSFAVGGASGRHLFVADKNTNISGVSNVELFDCEDTPPFFGEPPACRIDSNSNPVNWRGQTLGGVTNRYQPNVTASPGSDEVAVTWYQQFSNTSSSFLFFAGLRSHNNAGNWAAPLLNARPAQVPCPDPSSDGEGAHYWGDYTASFILPFPYTNSSGDRRIVSARADSGGGCFDVVSDPDITFDQHVQATAW